MSEANQEMAKAMYKTVCTALDSMKLGYREFEEDMVVVLSHKGEDMNHDLMIAVDGDRQVIKVLEKPIMI